MNSTEVKGQISFQFLKGVPEIEKGGDSDHELSL